MCCTSVFWPEKQNIWIPIIYYIPHLYKNNKHEFLNLKFKRFISLWLIWLFDADLGIKGASRMAQIVRAAQDKPRENLFFLYSFQPQLQVLPRRRIVRLHVVTEKAQYLHGVLQHKQAQLCGRETKQSGPSQNMDFNVNAGKAQD